MASLLERLEAREQAARSRMEALRAEMDRLGEQAAAEQELLGRLEITRQTVIEVLAGDDVPGEDVAGIDPAPAGGVGAAASGASRVGMQVPVFGQDGDGGGAGCRWPTGTWWRWWPTPAHCAPGRCARRLGWGPSPSVGRGCGSSSSGWWSVAGWSRSPRACSPALLVWLVG